MSSVVSSSTSSLQINNNNNNQYAQQSYKDKICDSMSSPMILIQQPTSHTEQTNTFRQQSSTTLATPVHSNIQLTILASSSSSLNNLNYKKSNNQSIEVGNLLPNSSSSSSSSNMPIQQQQLNYSNGALINKYTTSSSSMMPAQSSSASNQVESNNGMLNTVNHQYALNNLNNQHSSLVAHNPSTIPISSSSSSSSASSSSSSSASASSSSSAAINYSSSQLLASIPSTSIYSQTISLPQQQSIIPTAQQQQFSSQFINNNNNSSNLINYPNNPAMLNLIDSTQSIYTNQALLPNSQHIYLTNSNGLINQFQSQQQQQQQQPIQDQYTSQQPQLAFNKANRLFVPLYCGSCRAYGCQCFYGAATNFDISINNNSNSSNNNNQITQTQISIVPSTSQIGVTNQILMANNQQQQQQQSSAPTSISYLPNNHHHQYLTNQQQLTPSSLLKQKQNLNNLTSLTNTSTSSASSIVSQPPSENASLTTNSLNNSSSTPISYSNPTSSIKNIQNVEQQHQQYATAAAIAYYNYVQNSQSSGVNPLFTNINPANLKNPSLLLTINPTRNNTDTHNNSPNQIQLHPNQLFQTQKNSQLPAHGYILVPEHNINNFHDLNTSMEHHHQHQLQNNLIQNQSNSLNYHLIHNSNNNLPLLNSTPSLLQMPHQQSDVIYINTKRIDLTANSNNSISSQPQIAAPKIDKNYQFQKKFNFSSNSIRPNNKSINLNKYKNNNSSLSSSPNSITKSSLTNSISSSTTTTTNTNNNENVRNSADRSSSTSSRSLDKNEQSNQIIDNLLNDKFKTLNLNNSRPNSNKFSDTSSIYNNNNSSIQNQQKFQNNENKTRHGQRRNNDIGQHNDDDDVNHSTNINMLPTSILSYYHTGQFVNDQQSLSNMMPKQIHLNGNNNYSPQQQQHQQQFNNNINNYQTHRTPSYINVTSNRSPINTLSNNYPNQQQDLNPNANHRLINKINNNLLNQNFNVGGNNIQPNNLNSKSSYPNAKAIAAYIAATTAANMFQMQQQQHTQPQHHQQNQYNLIPAHLAYNQNPSHNNYQLTQRQYFNHSPTPNQLAGFMPINSNHPRSKFNNKNFNTINPNRFMTATNIYNNNFGYKNNNNNRPTTYSVGNSNLKHLNNSQKFAAYKSLLYKSESSSSTTSLSSLTAPISTHTNGSTYHKDMNYLSSFNKNKHLANNNNTNLLNRSTNVNSSSIPQSYTLCRHGNNCRFKRENKCKYYHPPTTIGQTNNSLTSNNTTNNNVFNSSNYLINNNNNHNKNQFKSESTIDITEYSIDSTDFIEKDEISSKHLDVINHNKSNNKKKIDGYMDTDKDTKTRLHTNGCSLSTSDQIPIISYMNPPNQNDLVDDIDDSDNDDDDIDDIDDLKLDDKTIDLSSKLKKINSNSLSSSASSLASSKTLTKDSFIQNSTSNLNVASTV